MVVVNTNKRGWIEQMFYYSDTLQEMIDLFCEVIEWNEDFVSLKSQFSENIIVFEDNPVLQGVIKEGIERVFQSINDLMTGQLIMAKRMNS